MSMMTGKVVLKVRSIGRVLGLNRLISRLIMGRDYEEKFSNLMLNSIQYGDCVWDVGANVGLYATKFSDRVGIDGHVVCFEPSPINVAKLRHATNGRNNISIQQAALGSVKESVSFSQGLDNLGATSRVLTLGDQLAEDVIKVSVERGDYLVSNGVVPTPAVIKIDVEGFELDVLIGLKETIKQSKVRAIFIEVHFSLLEQRGFPNAPSEIETILKNAGFNYKWPDASHIAGFRSEQ